MGLWSRIKKTLSPDRLSEEIQEELQFHLHMEMADGRDSQEARKRLGGLTRIKEETRSVGIIEWLDSVLQDAGYGVRQPRKTPALVLAVVLSLTIGVGANTPIASLSIFALVATTLIAAWLPARRAAARSRSARPLCRCWHRRR